MTISTKSFTTLVSDMVTAVQAQATALIDFSSGGIIRALIEAYAGAGLWFQSLVLQVAALTRLATSSGADVDSFVNDFGYERAQAVAAVANCTFARFTSTAQALIQPGANVGTLDGTQTFTVVANTSNPAWSSDLGGYVIPAGTASIANIPVQAVTAGAAGNVVAGFIGLLLTAIPGVDTVTNPAPATGGADEQADAQVKTGFVTYIQSLASATTLAIENAISSVQAGLTWDIQQGVNSTGASQPGYLTITVDDGTGDPPSALLTAIYTAVGVVRAAGISYGVFAPTTITANVSMTVTAAAGYASSTVISAVQTALTTYLAGLTLGTSLPYTKLAQIAYEASAGVADVTNVLLNSGTADLNLTGSQKIVAGTVTVTSA